MDITNLQSPFLFIFINLLIYFNFVNNPKIYFNLGPNETSYFHYVAFAAAELELSVAGVVVVVSAFPQPSINLRISVYIS